MNGPDIWTQLSWGDQGWLDEFAGGAWVTVQISVCGYILAFIFGLAGAAAKLSGKKWLIRIGDLYTTLVRALPELLLLLILYYTGTGAIKAVLVGLGLASEDIQISAFGAVVAALGFIVGAYMTEVLRGAIQAVPKGQLEAARAYGMPFFLRFRRILFPLMMRYATPGMGNLWLNITKDFALVVVVGAVSELVMVGKTAGGFQRNYLLFYSVTALCFLVITVTSMLLQAAIERRLMRGLRR